MQSPPSQPGHRTRRPTLTLLVLASLAALGALGCGPIASSDSDGGATGNLVASFTQDATAGTPGTMVQFTDTSTGGPTAWSWDFGAAGTRAEQNPLVTFASDGFYTVKLTVTNARGASSVTRTDLISIGGPVTAGFSCTPAGLTGQAPLTVTCTDESMGATSWSWDFGGEGSSTEQNPSFTFTRAGTFTIEQTAVGPGGSAMASQVAEVTAPAAPVAAFSCKPTLQPGFPGPNPEGYLDFAITCTDASQNASSWSWSFGDGGTSSEQNPQYTYMQAGSFEITLTATGAGGMATATATAIVHALDITFDPATGAAPLDVTMYPDDPAGRLGSFTWIVDGENLGTQPVLDYRFLTPGTYSVQLFGVRVTPPMVGSVIRDYVVDFGAPVAGIEPTPIRGFGPLAARLQDRSGGMVEKWEWSFGDGEGCVYPPPSPDDPMNPPCDSSSPVHTYEATGSFDVSLTVTGPSTEGGPADTSDSTTASDLVRIYIGDPSFEEQATNGAISLPWESLRPADELEPASHLALSAALGGADLAMPADRNKWASIDGLGTDGATAVDVIDNGIRQDFMVPPGQPVIELDFALLYAEPPVALVLDAMVATVSDGVTEVVIPSSRADTTSPYAGTSLRFPSRDGGEVLTTPRLTASLDLEEAFPASTDLTRFTLTIRTTNAVNERRSPRAYVDDIRFTESLDALPVDFEVEPVPAIAGRPVDFVDTSCPDGDDTCVEPTSWRWDFDTQGLPSSPDASGSGDQNPTYVFDEPGTYDVTLVARRADAEGTVTKQLTVLEEPMASFDIVQPEPWTAPAALDFADASTSDVADPIVAWSWDFGGFGDPGQLSLQNPGPIDFPLVGSVDVSLTVTTSMGVQASVSRTIDIEPAP